MKTLKTWATAATLLAVTGTAPAALVSLGDGTVKDTNTNLIWLQNWNINERAAWGTQKNWADNLTFAGSSDWELPEISEFVDLFTAYGDLGLVPEFTNVQFGSYWSGTEIAGNVAWSFNPLSGGQSGVVKSGQFFAVAVRPADVIASVPEPQTLALALLALGATAVARKARSR